MYSIRMAAPPLRSLFLDMNAFFASVEQQDHPSLRGRPVAVRPVATDSTCCIAASYEAKRFGIRTGTNVGEARRLCRGLVVVEARPERYVDVHEQIVAAVDTVLPVDRVCSIDEMACRLIGREREPETAFELGRAVKRAIHERVGSHLRCSVGLAPNRFLSKIATNLQKPDGLVLLDPSELPGSLFGLELRDLPGIGANMHRRLIDRGIHSVERLCALSKSEMRNAWNSVVGAQWWRLLRGEDVPDPPPVRRSLGHSHVLPLEFRTDDGCRTVLVRLVHKAASRLRRLGFWAERMEVRIDGQRGTPDWSASAKLGPCRDTSTFLEAFGRLWNGKSPTPAPLRVGVTFSNLSRNENVAGSLLGEDRRRQAVSNVVDEINDRLGNDRVHFGSMLGARETAPMRIAFNHIPSAATGYRERPS